MITEDYLSFETAKLLKEKGFDWLESPFYSEQDRDEWKQNACYSIQNPCYNENIPFDAPTLYVTAPHVSHQIAMKWLREVHNIHVVPKFDFYAGYYTGRIYDGRRESAVEKEDYIAVVGNRTYEQASEEAIKYTLENLI